MEKLKIHLRTDDEQKEIYQKHKLAFPGQLIVLIVPDNRSNISLKRQIYICPRHKIFQDLMFQIKKNMDVKEYEAVYYFIGKNTLVSVGAYMSVLQDDYGTDDDFLRITVCKENAFGCCL